jgi:hypothetical protein
MRGNTGMHLRMALLLACHLLVVAWRLVVLLIDCRTRSLSVVGRDTLGSACVLVWALLLVVLLSSCANPYVQAAAEGFLRGTMRPVTTCTTTYTSYHGRSGASTNCHTY